MQKLIEAVQNFLGLYDTPVERRKHESDSLYNETIKFAKEALAEAVNVPENQLGKSTLKPSVLQMLRIGKGCGLTYVGEAYNNYMNHYDCFFLLSDYENQLRQFEQDLKDCGFVVKTDSGYGIKDITIKEALKQFDGECIDPIEMEQILQRWDNIRMMLLVDRNEGSLPREAFENLIEHAYDLGRQSANLIKHPLDNYEVVCDNTNNEDF